MARATGQGHVISYLHGLRGSAHAVLGDLRAAADCFDDELDAALLTGSDWTRSLALQHQCWIAICRGDLDHALRLGEEAVACADTALSGHAGAARGMLGQVHLHRGDPATALGLLLSGGGADLELAEPGRPTCTGTRRSPPPRPPWATPMRPSAGPIARTPTPPGSPGTPAWPGSPAPTRCCPPTRPAPPPTPRPRPSC